MTKDEHAALKVGDKVYCCHQPGGTWTVRGFAVSSVHPALGAMVGDGLGARKVNAAFWHVSPLAAIEAAIERHPSLDELREMRQELEAKP